MVAISYDSLDTIQIFAEEKALGFPLLSDEKQEVLARYGLRTKDGYSIPGTYLVGKDGTVHSEFFLDGYKKRVTNEELLKAAAKMSQP